MAKQNGVQVWVQSREKLKKGTNACDAQNEKLDRVSERVSEQVRVKSQIPLNLPLVVYLGTRRLWYQGRYTSKCWTKRNSIAAYTRPWGTKTALPPHPVTNSSRTGMVGCSKAAGNYKFSELEKLQLFWSGKMEAFQQYDCCRQAGSERTDTSSHGLARH